MGEMSDAKKPGKRAAKRTAESDGGKKARKKVRKAPAEKTDKVEEASDGELEAELEYEKKLRLAPGSFEKRQLPVKSESGNVFEKRQDMNIMSLVYPESDKPKKAQPEAEAPENSVVAKPKKKKKEVKEPVVLNAAGKLLLRQEKKALIAKYSEMILSDPEKGVLKGTEKSPIRSLLGMARSDSDRVIRKLAILSLVAVFKDILPGYRIVIIEGDNKLLTKAVRLHRRFDKELLETYQDFLKILHQIVSKLGPPDALKDHRKKMKDLLSIELLELVLVSIRAMCTLLVVRPTFNFRENLLASVIPRMNSLYEQVRSQCCACITTLLEEDVTGDITLEVIVYASKYIRTHQHGVNGSVHPDFCKPLLRCNLKGDLKDIKSTDKAKAAKKKKKKSIKKRDDVALGVDEADANIDALNKHAKNTEALRELFTMYLRVLKRGPQSGLLPGVLRGVARYVHLINIEIAQALITVLTNLTKGNTLSVESGLQAVHTVALTLRGPGSELSVDETEFIAYLYRAVIRLIEMPDCDSLVPLLTRAVEGLFLGRKLYQHNRVAAVVTRLGVLTNYCSPHAALAVVALIRELMTRYASACRPLLDIETEVGEGGNSLALGILPSSNDAIDPALLQHDSTSLWSLAQLRFHYHPFVREFSQQALKMAYLLPSDRPTKLFQAYDPYHEGGFNPPVQKTLNVHIPKKKNFYKKKNQTKK